MTRLLLSTVLNFILLGIFDINMVLCHRRLAYFQADEFGEFKDNSELFLCAGDVQKKSSLT